VYLNDGAISHTRLSLGQLDKTRVYRHYKTSMRKNTQILLSVVIIVILGVGIVGKLSKSPEDREVVVYVSHDQDYAEPVLKEFETKTGILVKAVYDTEASKTVGLTNRLIAEKENPTADVFWNNEVTHTIQLKQEGVLDTYKPVRFDDIPDFAKDADGYWTGFAARARVLLVSNNSKIPERLEDLVGETYAQNVSVADARFGTTGSHVAALWVVWGEEKTKEYLLNLTQQGLNVAQSNGQTRDKVVSGEKTIAFTDSDDANDAISQGDNVTMVYPNQNDIGTLIIPNTVALIKNAPHRDEAKELISFLISPEVESLLAYAKSAQMPLLPDVKKPDSVTSVMDIVAMNVDWNDIYAAYEPAVRFFTDEILK